MITSSNIFQCRQFAPELLIKDFDLKKFEGRWFTQFYQTNSAPYREGTCPVSYFQSANPISLSDAKFRPLLNSFKDIEQYQPFFKRDISKGQTNYIIRDVLSKGWILPPKGNNIGSVWGSLQTKPASSSDGNFQVLNTDYDSYAIIYMCAKNGYTPLLMGKEEILIYTRDRFGSSNSSEKSIYGDIDSQLQSKIEEEFNKLFVQSNSTASNQTQENQPVVDKNQPKSDLVFSVFKKMFGPLNQQPRNLNFKIDMSKAAQNDDCLSAIPENFEFSSGIPKNFLLPAFSKSNIAVIPPWRRVNIKSIPSSQDQKIESTPKNQTDSLLSKTESAPNLLSNTTSPTNATEGIKK